MYRLSSPWCFITKDYGMKSHFVPLLPLHSPHSVIYSSPQAAAGLWHPGELEGDKVGAQTHGSDGSRDASSTHATAQWGGVCQECPRLLSTV